MSVAFEAVVAPGILSDAVVAELSIFKYIPDADEPPAVTSIVPTLAPLPLVYGRSVSLAAPTPEPLLVSVTKPWATTRRPIFV